MTKFEWNIILVICFTHSQDETDRDNELSFDQFIHTTSHNENKHMICANGMLLTYCFLFLSLSHYPAIYPGQYHDTTVENSVHSPNKC